MKPEAKSLTNHNGLNLKSKAQYFFDFSSTEDLRKITNFANKENKNIQIIGSGTNAIFPEYFSDIVVKSTNNDFSLSDKGDEVILRVGAAVVWDDLVDFCVNKGLFGLGNLAGIPGTVGAAPVQNIGAYGEEISNFIDHVECFDVSHTQGSSTVAACVVFTASGITTSEYRRFTITGITPGDDYAAMHQALLRRYTKRKQDDAPLPDLILIDGGKGQLARAILVMDELQITSIPLLGVAKGVSRKAGEETLFLNNPSHPISLEADSVALHTIQLIRDESHRFAIAGHRARRKKQFIGSPLENVEGVGPKRRQALLQHFGGMQGLLQADQQEIASVPGISLALAEVIYRALH